MYYVLDVQKYVVIKTFKNEQIGKLTKVELF